MTYEEALALLQERPMSDWPDVERTIITLTNFAADYWGNRDYENDNEQNPKDAAQLFVNSYGIAPAQQALVMATFALEYAAQTRLDGSLDDEDAEDAEDA